MQGGIRVNAFVSGGFLPAAKRGTELDAYIHIADWCAWSRLGCCMHVVRCILQVTLYVATSHRAHCGSLRAAAAAGRKLLDAVVRHLKAAHRPILPRRYATLCALAGVDAADEPAAKAGLPPIDSINQWPVIGGSVAELVRLRAAARPCTAGTRGRTAQAAAVEGRREVTAL